MNPFKLAAAAAVLVTTLGVAGAQAQPPMRERTVVRTDGDRTVVRTRTVVRRDDDRGMRGDRHDRGRHEGWQRGRHHGWSHQTRRTCRTVWHHGRRDRVCRVVRWR